MDAKRFNTGIDNASGEIIGFLTCCFRIFSRYSKIEKGAVTKVFFISGGHFP